MALSFVFFHHLCQYFFQLKSAIHPKGVVVKWTKIFLIKREGNGHKMNRNPSEGSVHILRRCCTNFKMQRNYTYMNRDPCDKRRRKCTYSKKAMYILSEGFIHILRRFCTNFKMRRNYTYSKKVLYIFSISQKDLRRCEGSLKDLYTPCGCKTIKNESIGL